MGVQQQDVPSELGRREVRLAKIAEAKAAVESEARRTQAEHLAALTCQQANVAASSANKADADAALKRAHNNLNEVKRIVSSGPDDGSPAIGGNTTEEGLITHRTSATSDGLPTEGAERNFTDPDSRIMKAADGYVQGYNCQQAVDEGHQRHGFRKGFETGGKVP